MEKPPLDDESIAICFTQGHKEKLVIEEVHHEGLVDMLFKSGYRLGKIETWISWTELHTKNYRIIVIGSPGEEKFKDIEIKEVINFVNEGGSLFLVGDEGGEAFSQSNINELAEKFGFSFNDDTIFDETQYHYQPEYVKITNMQKHFITRDVKEFVFASGCSISVTDPSILVLAKTGENAQRRLWQDGKWGEPEPAPGVPVIIVKRHGRGKIVAMGNYSILTSLSRKYGLYTLDNFTLIGNIFAWLSNKKPDDVDKSSMIFVNVALDHDIYFWIERELRKNRFKNLNSIVNFALNTLKESLESYNLESKNKNT
ncbi:MAG: Gldg family protein [Promethearchaeota archaeon]